jgi:hypothetical protein
VAERRQQGFAAGTVLRSAPPAPEGPPAATRPSPPAHRLPYRPASRLRGSVVATLGQRRVDRTGNREHIPALLGRLARGDQGAGLGRGLDHQHPGGQAADDPVALGKLPGKGGVPIGYSLTMQPSCAMRSPARGCAPDRPGRRRCRPRRWWSPAAQRAFVGGGIDAQRQARTRCTGRRRPAPRRRPAHSPCPARWHCGCRRWPGKGRPAVPHALLYRAAAADRECWRAIRIAGLAQRQHVVPGAGASAAWRRSGAPCRLKDGCSSACARAGPTCAASAVTAGWRRWRAGLPKAASRLRRCADPPRRSGAASRAAARRPVGPCPARWFTPVISPRRRLAPASSLA